MFDLNPLLLKLLTQSFLKFTEADFPPTVISNPPSGGTRITNIYQDATGQLAWSTT